MEVFFNHKKYESMKELQNDYQQWLKCSDDEYFNFKIFDEGQLVFVNDFKKDINELNIFEYIHKGLTEQLIALKIDDFYYAETLEYELDLFEELYVRYINEIEENSLILSYDEIDNYYDYLSEDDIFAICQQCALFDIENDDRKSYDELMEEYMNLSPQQLCYEFEQKYDYDYYVAKLDKDISVSPILNRRNQKIKQTYVDLKSYQLKNTLQMEIKKK